MKISICNTRKICEDLSDELNVNATIIGSFAAFRIPGNDKFIGLAHKEINQWVMVTVYHEDETTGILIVIKEARDR